MSGHEKLVEMGRLGKAIGLKGEMYLLWHGENLPHAGQTLQIRDSAGNLKIFPVLGLRFHKEKPVILLENINDRTAAENLNGSSVYQDREDLVQPEEDEVFLADLIGNEIYLSDGTLIGVLKHVEFPANQQIWVIAGKEGREILFPAQPCFIEAFYPEDKKIVISPPPGLLEIYA